MLMTLAWRNIWRNRRRTIITTGSIAFGLTLAIFFIALGKGMYANLIDQVVRMQAGHLTIQHPDYAAAPAVDLYVTGINEMAAEIAAWPETEAVKILIQGQGIAKSGEGNVAAALIGIQPSKEKGVSPFARSLMEGAYLNDDDLRKVVIGVEMAEKLDLAVGKKLVLSTNNADGDLVQELMRVKGIYQTGSEEMDAFFVQMTSGFGRKLFGLPENTATRIGVVLKQAEDMDLIRGRIEQLLTGSATVLRWEEVMPDISSWIKLDQGSNYVFQLILLILILFTIFNTILMSVIERQREFALLLAIGTKPGQLRAQIFIESLFLGLLGCAAGIIGGTLVSYAVSVYGIDMRRWLEEGFAVSGYMMDPVLRTKVTLGVVFGASAIVLIATLLFCLFPARRAANVNITDTLRAAG
ncbi:MAG: FtsX-like permease family protein [Desulfotignum sp.]